MTNLRSLPRVFIPGVTADEPIELPKEEIDKLRKVLRLSAGDLIAVLPNDGTAIICRFENKVAVPVEVQNPDTEANIVVTIAQALPKADKIEEVVRAGTEVGVSRFLLFSSERTVVKWEAEKLASRVTRLQAIARESSELAFRTKMPVFDTASDLATVLAAENDPIVLSEAEGLNRNFTTIAKGRQSVTIVVGPEGGWTQRELELIGDRAVTLGKRVLRTEHAGPLAAALLLLR